MNHGKMLGIIILLLGVVLFTLQNTEQVQVHFLFWQFSASRALMLFIVLAIGFFSGWLTKSLQDRYRKPEDSLQSPSRGPDQHPQDR